MARVLILSLAVVCVFFGLSTVMPILEGTEGERQVAVVVGAFKNSPSCIISSHPNAISLGESAGIAWGSEHASLAQLSDAGEVSLQGGMFVTPLNTTTYTLTVSAPTGEVSSCNTVITVR